jgi:hypothetical protein
MMGTTALEMAVFSNHVDVSRHIVQSVNINWWDASCLLTDYLRNLTQPMIVFLINLNAKLFDDFDIRSLSYLEKSVLRSCMMTFRKERLQIYFDSHTSELITLFIDGWEEFMEVMLEPRSRF